MATSIGSGLNNAPRISTASSRILPTQAAAEPDAAAGSDSVVLGQSSATQPPAPSVKSTSISEVPEEEPKEESPLTLKLSDLSKPVKNAKVKEILGEIDAEMTLAKLADLLFETDPVARGQSTFSLHFEKGKNWRSVSLNATRDLSNGKVESLVRIGRGSNETRVPKPYARVLYTPDTMPTGNQLPDLMQKFWSDQFDGSPKDLEKQTRVEFGDLGEPNNIRIQLSGLDLEKPYMSLSWMGKAGEETRSRVSLNGGGSRNITRMFKAEELESPDGLPQSMRETWEGWGVSPGAMVDAMFKGAIAKPEMVDVGVTSDRAGNPGVSIGVNMVGRKGELKDKDAGRVAFDLYTEPSEDGSTKKVAYHNLLSFGKDFQGKGLAKSILRANFDLYDRLAIDKVDLTAAITVGGYAWARYGWQLKDNSPESLATQVRERMESLTLKPAQTKAVNAILKAGGPKMNWALSDLRQPTEKDGKETTLGKALLLGTHWSGTFDMHDKASRTRLSRYLG